MSVNTNLAEAMRSLPGTLLGFDAREMFIDSSTFWPPERRATYLLCEDVKKPLAVDTLVWPSVFGEGLPAYDRRRLGVDGADIPVWKGPNEGLWQNLAEMREFLDQLASEKYLTVAVVAATGSGPKGSSPCHPGEEAVTPTNSEVWTLLGLDVADAGLISGLSNCAYESTERAGLRASWGRLLNEHHLFNQLQAAMAFRELCDTRIAEHAPFYVYGLFAAAT
jgi:hypothetical protein